MKTATQSLSYRLPATLMLGTILLAGCAMQPPLPVTTQPTPPVKSAAPAPRPAPAATSPYATAPAPTPSVQPAAVKPSGPTGPVDGRTGLHKAALVSVAGSAESQFIVLFRPGQTSSGNISGAPAKLCGSAGVASSRTNSASSGSAMPGVQTMIVKCGAA